MMAENAPESVAETFRFRQLSRVRSLRFNWTLVCQWVAKLQTFLLPPTPGDASTAIFFKCNFMSILSCGMGPGRQWTAGRGQWGMTEAKEQLLSGSGQALQVSREMSRVHDLWSQASGPETSCADCQVSNKSQAMPIFYTQQKECTFRKFPILESYPFCLHLVLVFS